MEVVMLIWTLHLVDLARGQGHPKVPRHRRSLVVPRVCQPGCLSCSALNGCLSCKPRLFLHLDQEGVRQTGACLSSCPQGHYGTRTPSINFCTKCKEDCASCFNRNFCTRCHPGHFLFQGRCERSCPVGLTPNNAIRECTECPMGCELCIRRNTCARCRPDLYFLQGLCHHSCPMGFQADGPVMECLPRESCEVSEWGPWGRCLRRGNVLAYRRGEETRTREVLRMPGHHANPCPHVSEWRKCVIKKRLSPR